MIGSNQFNMIKGIHHIAIICSDFEKSKHFYCEVLGFKIIKETFRQERQSYKLDLQLPDLTQIELFSFPNPPPRVSHPEARGLRHLSFRVEKLEPIIERLHTFGIQTENIRIDEMTNRRFTFFMDPDQLPLELYES